MERLVAAGETTSPSEYVSWEEVFVSSDKGRREVHYFLKRRDGASDLAVIGKEKSLRHMSYHYAIRDRALLPSSSSLSKLKSRREVVDWLNFIVSGAYPYPSFSPFDFSEIVLGFFPRSMGFFGGSEIRLIEEEKMSLGVVCRCFCIQFGLSLWEVFFFVGLE